MIDGRRFLPSALAVCVLVVATTGLDALAQSLKGPVKILVGFAPGGGADLTARMFADKMSPMLGVPVIVENKTGAGGRVAAEALKNASPDNTTLLLTPIVVPVLAPLIYSNLSYDPVKDFAPVSLVGYFQFGFAVGGTHPAKTMQEFVAWARENPTQANFGSPAPGSLPHFFGVMIGKSIGVDMQHIAYRGGAPMMNDLVGGQIPAGIDTTIELVEQHRAGKIRVLATAGTTRSPLFPDVPTMRELGFRDVEGAAWYAFYAPAAMPANVVAELNRTIAAAAAMPDVKERLTKLGVDVQTSTPEELARLAAADRAKWAPIIKASGFKGD